MMKIKAFTITNLFVIIVPSLAQVSWVVNNTAEFKNGDTMELICTVTGSCCSSARKWNGGPSFSLLMNDGVPSDSNKYGEIIHSNSFSLLIYNMDRSDFLYDYRCTYGFGDSTRSALSPPGNARYVPAASEIQELSLSTVDNELNFEVNVTTVFPAPSCTAEFGGADFTSSMTLTSTDNFPFKFAEISMANVAYTCPGSLDVSCSVGSYSFNVLTLDPCTGDEGNSSGTWVTPLVIVLILGGFAVIIITGICCLYNTRCNSRYLRKNSKYTFTLPKTALVVGKHDCLHVMIINITIILKLTEYKLSSIKLLKWKKSLSTDKTKVRELESTSNNELILSKITKKDEGRYWCEVIDKDGTSTNSGILTLQVVHDIVNVGKKSVSYSATLGDSIQIRCTREISPQHIKFIAKRSDTNQIAPEAKITKITDTASLLFEKISMRDEGCYLFESADGKARTGVLTLSVMEGNERYNTFYKEKSGIGSQTLQPRNGAKTTLVSIPEKNDVVKKKSKKRKKNKNEYEEEVVELESQTACETTPEEKEIT